MHAALRQFLPIGNPSLIRAIIKQSDRKNIQSSGRSSRGSEWMEMRKFRFKFATVLKLRKTREEDALRALGAAQRAYQAELDKKAQLKKDLEDALVRRENLGAGSDSIGILPFQLEEDFIRGTKQRIVHADRDIVRAGRAVEKALRVFLFARRQTRMMEMLYDKAHQEWRKAEAKREQKQLDDLTIMRERFRENYL